eukprot:gene20836-19024_t
MTKSDLAAIAAPALTAALEAEELPPVLGHVMPSPGAVVTHPAPPPPLLTLMRVAVAVGADIDDAADAE